MGEDLKDLEVTCRDCERPFLFSAGEQKFYQSKGFQPPKRCKDCRAAKKAAEASREPRA